MIKLAKCIKCGMCHRKWEEKACTGQMQSWPQQAELWLLQWEEDALTVGHPYKAQIRDTSFHSPRQAALFLVDHLAKLKLLRCYFC